MNNCWSAVFKKKIADKQSLFSSRKLRLSASLEAEKLNLVYLLLGNRVNKQTSIKNSRFLKAFIIK